MKQIYIFWTDLTEKKQKEIKELVGSDNNWDIFPMSIIDVEEDDE